MSMQNISEKKDDYFDNIDSSDEEEIRNSIGNIPLSWYEDYPHIGYTQDGQKIYRPAIGNELDKFLDKMENPDYWKTVTNLSTGQDTILNKMEISSIKKIIFHNFSLNNHTPWLDIFSNEVMIHPLINTPPSKKSFIPSLVEKEKVNKLVYAMKMGWIKHTKPNVDKSLDEPEEYQYTFCRDIWKNSINENEDTMSKRTINRISHYIPAPKLPLPNHIESYNPPSEYLFDENEKLVWEQKEPEERKIDFIPKKYPNLRLVPAYENFLKEQYERCCDLYLCPRVKKMKANLENAEDLLPKLPKPSDLRPFPTNLAIVYRGHTGPVTSVSIDSIFNGRYLCSGSNDASVRFWEIGTGRCLATISAFSSFEHPVMSVAWRPLGRPPLANEPAFAFAAGDNVYICALPPLIVPGNYNHDHQGSEDKDKTSHEIVKDKVMTKDSMDADGKTAETDLENEPTEDPKSIVTWIKPSKKQRDMNILFILKHPKLVTKIEWHKGADYILSVCAKNGASSIILNKISQKHSQAPFKKMKGNIQTASFHPKAPILFVATQKYVKIYNMVQKELTKVLISSCKWISSLAIHPSGDNLIVGSYDNKVAWFDIDLACRPYKILKFHSTSVRAVAFHSKLPLFASASEDSSLIITHGMVYKTSFPRHWESATFLILRITHL
ncbi:unnamed protein product [Gordionus sp. m RMFG-2023]|uniref:ribosome biogenesis protein bop1-like isoform X2 n=1 Tax=Gordionus sp. m RMFG-2023 TaxID=3053472 RepID=UPI0030DE6F9D